MHIDLRNCRLSLLGLHTSRHVTLGGGWGEAARETDLGHALGNTGSKIVLQDLQVVYVVVLA